MGRSWQLLSALTFWILSLNLKWTWVENENTQQLLQRVSRKYFFSNFRNIHAGQCSSDHWNKFASTVLSLHSIKNQLRRLVNRQKLFSQTPHHRMGRFSKSRHQETGGERQVKVGESATKIRIAEQNKYSIFLIYSPNSKVFFTTFPVRPSSVAVWSCRDISIWFMLGV